MFSEAGRGSAREEDEAASKEDEAARKGHEAR